MKLQMIAQPNDVTCGPTSLHAVYHYLGRDLDLISVIGAVDPLEGGGTLAASLGLDALARGFEACIYSYDLHLFDPTWAELDTPSLADKLRQQLHYKKGRKFQVATEAYVRFLERGGELRFADLSLGLLRTYFDRRLPVLAGLSATYLYRTMREYAVKANRTAYHDLKGEPAGHFVVLYGFSEHGVRVADPYRANPFEGHLYEVPPQRLLNAILLGIATYDANLLIVSPPLPA